MQKTPSFWFFIPEAVEASVPSSMLAVNSTTIYSVGMCLMKAVSAADKNHFFFRGALNCNGILNHSYGLETEKQQQHDYALKNSVKLLLIMSRKMKMYK